MNESKKHGLKHGEWMKQYEKLGGKPDQMAQHYYQTGITPAEAAKKEGLAEGFMGDAKDAIDAMKETSRLSKELVKDGEALGPKLQKATSREDAVKILRDHVKAAKKKIQASKMDKDLKDNFESSFLGSFYTSLAKQFGVESKDLKKLLESKVPYDEKFKSLAKKFGVSPDKVDELPEDKKKQFYAQLDAMHTSDKEAKALRRDESKQYTDRVKTLTEHLDKKGK